MANSKETSLRLNISSSMKTHKQRHAQVNIKASEMIKHQENAHMKYNPIQLGNGNFGNTFKSEFLVIPDLF